MHVKSFFTFTLFALDFALEETGWTKDRKGDGTYDIHWHKGKIGDEEYKNYTGGPLAVNKYPGMREACSKVNLTRKIEQLRSLYPDEYEFYPKTWILPDDREKFSADTKNGGSGDARRASDSSGFYIIKPPLGSHGDGIYLTNDPIGTGYDEKQNDKTIVQEYIASPLLLDGFKFDIRLYVLITSVDPLEVYLCKDGIVRLCTERYQRPDGENTSNLYMHLTNYHLNCKSDAFARTSSLRTGSKRTLRCLEETLSAEGFDVIAMRKEIERVVLRTVCAVSKDVIALVKSNVPDGVRCFQILGFDVMMSSKMKLHLLEVNTSPSYGTLTNTYAARARRVSPIFDPVDIQVKLPLIRDTLTLVAYGKDALDNEKSCLQRIHPEE